MVLRRGVLAGLSAVPVGLALSGEAIAQAGAGRAGAGTGPRLALKGYDPVAYFTDGKPIAGANNYELTWDGARYLFASAQHLELFRQNPDKYAPQFGGACTMNLVAGRKREADPHNWIISDGKLYVFAGAGGPANFAKDPRGNAARAAENWERLRGEVFR